MAKTLYMIECSNGSFYTGVTRRPWRKRIAEHKAGIGARHTRIYRPRKVVFVTNLPNDKSLNAAERAVKRLSRQQKKALISSKRNLLAKPKIRRTRRSNSYRSRFRTY
ncbi:MAG: GIY-YIG nuclease family protein [Xanthobacteraceae bacterium]